MRAYQDMVFSTAARLTASDAQAQDIAQDVFLRAFERFGQLRDSPTAGGWLKTVTRHLALNYLSRDRRRWRPFSELRQPFDDGEGATAEQAEALATSAAPREDETDRLLTDLSAEQRRALVDEALGALPPHQRLPLVLYHFEELPYEEIARQLGISLAKVKTDIHRARAALLRVLQARGLALDSLTE
jgi:RNA polymerase sigma-70 factor (ECF subfamily)